MQNAGKIMRKLMPFGHIHPNYGIVMIKEIYKPQHGI
jgi:hypothetical protein